ncbi:hypothetical protein [Pseudomonas sp.]|uniref:hypothetical protein n=1 Tax=Pseudomonas sp. TaxID=306 RepID=UPI00258FB315|nr:hypothetical protein [Pseudomonas sp.]
MTPLPTGYTLCRPADPGPRCHNCRRWADHPEQVIGQITRVVKTSGQRDPACVHFPISYLKDAK